MATVATHPTTHAESLVFNAVREYGADYTAPDLIGEIARRTQLTERVVRAVLWALIAQGEIDLTSDGRAIVSA